MGLSIRSNTDSLVAQTNINRTSQELSQTFERLSSGLRINSASDDPAGLALSAKLEADGRIATTAIRNANDGISMAAITDDALTEVGSILSRMLELATQSSNGTYSTSQRSALSTEFVSLGSEIDRIAKTTQFNNKNLLSATSDTSIQVGLDGGTNSFITLTGIRGTLDALGLAATGGSALVYSLITTSDTGSTYASATALSAVRNAIDSLTSIRGTIGAAESRLNRAVGYLQVVRENYIAAANKIRDVDVAEEVANMVRLQVLQQSGVAVLAQANQTPSTVLKLLG